jgi:hypothetical protein
MNLAKTVHSTTIIFNSMLTLTYPAIYPKSGQLVKQDLNRFLTWMRKHFPGNYLWFLEFQRRGAPHIHLLTEAKHPGSDGHRRFADAWCSAQKLDPTATHWDKKREYQYLLRKRCFEFHCRAKQWEAVREQNGAKRYALQYALKPHQKTVPKAFSDVGRFWGTSKGVKATVTEKARYELKTGELRAMLRIAGHSTARMPFIPKNVFNAGKVEEMMGIPATGDEQSDFLTQVSPGT